jgi:hypothetical protein
MKKVMNTMKTKKFFASLIVFAVIFLLTDNAGSYTMTHLSQVNGAISQLSQLKNQMRTQVERDDFQRAIEVLERRKTLIKNELVGFNAKPSWTTANLSQVKKVIDRLNQLQNQQDTLALLNGQYAQIKCESIGAPPNCGSVPNNPTPIQVPSSIAGAEAAIQWALSLVGQNKYSNFCLAFVADAYKKSQNKVIDVNICSPYRCLTAKEAANIHALTQNYNAPRGALVFWDYKKLGKNLGHVGISLGNDQFVSALPSKIAVTRLSTYDKNNYLGWSYPPPDPR